jgi:catechol-2,3-dioxygenase
MTNEFAAPLTSVVVYAKEITPVAEFYRRTLGLSTIEQAPGFVVLAGPGVELNVVRVPEHIADAITITQPPQLREETPLKFSFLVPSLEAVRVQAVATGGGLKPAAEAWIWRGMLHLDGYDPEGNVVQFRSEA